MKSTFRSTIDDIRRQVRESGSSLTKLPTEFHARSLHDWLKEKLPKHLDVWIIEAPGRENEVNVYTNGNFKREGVDVGINVRSPEAVRMPERVKRWKRDRFGVCKKI
jgi:hypothetical protein